MELELIGLGLIALAASSIVIEQIMRDRPRPAPLLVMNDERRRRAAERLHVERLFARHDDRR